MGPHEAISYSQESQRVDGESCTMEGVIGKKGKEGKRREREGKEGGCRHKSTNKGWKNDKGEKEQKWLYCCWEGRKEGRKVEELEC